MRSCPKTEKLAQELGFDGMPSDPWKTSEQPTIRRERSMSALACTQQVTGVGAAISYREPT